MKSFDWIRPKPRGRLAQWFWLVAITIVAIDAYVASVGYVDRALEAGIIVDLVLLIPMLYFIAFRGTRKGVVGRALGFACLGVWIGTKIIPETEWYLLSLLEPLRSIGLVVLVLIEVALLVHIFRAVVGGRSEAALVSELQTEKQMPGWVAKLLPWEADIWNRVLKAVRRVLSSNREQR